MSIPQDGTKYMLLNANGTSVMDLEAANRPISPKLEGGRSSSLRTPTTRSGNCAPPRRAATETVGPTRQSQVRHRARPEREELEERHSVSGLLVDRVAPAAVAVRKARAVLPALHVSPRGESASLRARGVVTTHTAFATEPHPIRAGGRWVCADLDSGNTSPGYVRPLLRNGAHCKGQSSKLIVLPQN